MKHHQYNPHFEFVKPPVSFYKYTDRSLLQYCLGATMYMPGTKDFVQKIVDKSYPGLTSMVMCFEDACPEKEVPAAELNSIHLLDELDRLVNDGTLDYKDIPLIFFRVRNVEQFRHFSSMLKPEHVKRGWTFNAIPFQANAGIKYVMPFYDRLNVGVIGQYNGYAGRPYWEARFGVGVNPLKWLDLSANIGRGSFGTVFGVAGSVCIGRFRIQGGLQNGFGGTIPYEGTPLQPNSKTITFGLTYDI